MRLGGFGVRELIRDSGFSGRQLKAAGFVAADVLEAPRMHMHMHMPVAPAHMHMHMPHRFVAADFLEAPCSVTELKAAGFAEAECTACGLERGVVAIVYAKRTREQLKAKLSVPEMVSAAGFTCEQAKRGGLLPSECHQAGY